MSFVIYGLIGLMPGDPIDLMIATLPNITPDDIARLRSLHGLDEPIWLRWWQWLTSALGGDLGNSRLYGAPVESVIAGPLLRSLMLIAASLVIALAIALPIGILAALRPRGVFDTVANLIAFVGLSMPTFWLGIMLIMVFAVTFGWLPAGGVPQSGAGVAETLRHMALPVATLAVATIGQYTRYMRAAMIESLNQDYVRTALAKGAGRWRVVLVHALRNAMIPVVTVLALDFGMLFSGALITETVFAWPGMGKLIFDAVMGNDYALALAALLLATAVTLLGNALADVAYGWLDPRIGRGSKAP
ncbi:MAG: diguanylate cyclase [Rhodospirillaceae bacterium BRH_c57]|nr:MAG: diguanylate cyclase [Rhodospirillaceae bacterium BRH_c57]